MTAVIKKYFPILTFILLAGCFFFGFDNTGYGNPIFGSQSISRCARHCIDQPAFSRPGRQWNRGRPFASVTAGQRVEKRKAMSAMNQVRDDQMESYASFFSGSSFITA